MFLTASSNFGAINTVFEESTLSLAFLTNYTSIVAKLFSCFTVKFFFAGFCSIFVSKLNPVFMMGG